MGNDIIGMSKRYFIDELYTT